MTESLETIAKLAVLVFVVTCMVTAGLGLSMRDIVTPLRSTRLVLVALIANFAIAPAVAYGLTEAIPLDRPYAIGLILLGSAAGAPFLPKLAELAKGDFAFSVGLMLILTVGSVIFMPIALPFMIPGLAASPWLIAQPLLVTMMLPLAAAMAFRQWFPRRSNQVQPVFRLISNVGLLAAVVLLICLNFRAMSGSVGSGAAATSVLFVVICLACGYALGRPFPKSRSVLGLGAGQRNIAAALVVGTRNFKEPGVVVMLLIVTFAGLVVLLLATRIFARRIPLTSEVTS